MSLEPIDFAIEDYLKGITGQNIIIKSDLSEDDLMEVDYYFRSPSLLPDIEKYALKNCTGKVLDVGACVGAHSIPLTKEGFDVTAIDISKNAVDYLKKQGVNAHQISFLEYNEDVFDTILLLMNGIGIAGTIDELPHFFEHCKKLLKPDGKIIADSTDVNYFYEDDDGSVWLDLNAKYYGEFKFQMEYKGNVGPWFNWLYIDFEKLNEVASNCGLTVNKIFENGDSFLAEIKLI